MKLARVAFAALWAALGCAAVLALLAGLLIAIWADAWVLGLRIAGTGAVALALWQVIQKAYDDSIKKARAF